MTVVALKRKQYTWHTMLPFIGFHVSALALVFTVPFTLTATFWFFGSYFLRMFGVTGGYHRYFSHRAYKLNRFWQFCMAFLAQTSGQKGILWWSAHHRDHHKYSDRIEDLHSPVNDGFWWSHLGWILSVDYDNYDPKRVADFGRFPELQWLNRWHLVPTVVYGAAILLIGGWSAFVWGFLVSTVALWHGTFVINSLSHIWGTKRFETKDESRNNFVLALVTLGEGWHNNHHHYMSSVRQGIRWWEIDVTFYVLKALSWIGITRDLRAFPDTKTGEKAA